MNLIFRAQVSFADYHEARGFTAEYLVKENPHNPATRAYFRAIARWESCLLNLQIFIDVMNKMKKEFKDDPVFEEGDGTVKQRSYSIANTVKHFGSDVFNDRHHEEHTVPLWLTNAGLQTHSHALTFNELAKPVSDVAITAAELQDPLSFGEHPK